jgi:hypothetical protein
LVSLEWVPLFVLGWNLWLQTPTRAKALVTGGVLFAVLLCDHYYFLYCVMVAFLMAGWRAMTTRQWFFLFLPAYRWPLAAFGGVTFLTSGVLVGALLWSNWQDPFLGAHDPLENSLDLLALFIPGGHWRFASLTQFYWAQVGDVNEHSTYLGWSVIGLVIYAAFRLLRTTEQRARWGMWYGLMGLFYLLALGPTWHLAGKPILANFTPYNAFLMIFPPLKLSGAPVRMIVIVILCAALLSAAGLQSLFQVLPRGRWLIAGIGLGLLLGVELLPRPLPTTALTIPAYVARLRALPPGGGVLDTVADTSIALYYQTLHEKPLVNGYISRYPTSVFTAWQQNRWRSSGRII